MGGRRSLMSEVTLHTISERERDSAREREMERERERERESGDIVKHGADMAGRQASLAFDCIACVEYT